MELKRAKVHMLPTDIKGGQGHTLWTNKNGQLLHTKTSSNHLQGQHLYFTTDEKIKEGDWFYNGMNKIVVKATNRYSEMKNPIPHRKIIATNDAELNKVNDENKIDESWFRPIIPQIPQHIIEAYAKKPFDEVEVEYWQDGDIIKYGVYHPSGKFSHNEFGDKILTEDPIYYSGKPKTKLNQDGTIVVSLVEEKMYTLKDIERAFYAGHHSFKEWVTGDGKPIHSFKEWIKENL